MESWTFFMKKYYLRIGQGKRSRVRRLCARLGNPVLRIMGGFDSAAKIYLLRIRREAGAKART
jgi:hypothetical protein